MSSLERHGRVELCGLPHASQTRSSHHKAGCPPLNGRSLSRCSEDIDRTAITQAQKQATEINDSLLKYEPMLQLDGLHDDQTSGLSGWSLLEQWWLLEWLSCLVSVLTMVAIIIILGKYDHQPLPDWPRHITINSLISVLGTTSKAMMLLTVSAGLGQLKWLWFRNRRPLQELDIFDGASRGFVGSLQLLYSVPLWHPGILGALITLIAVSMSPFIQQSIQYYSCSQPKPGAYASVPRTNYYWPGDAHVGAGEANLNLAMKGVVFAGVMNPSGNTGIPFDCPTGNCTFENPYTTLEICSSCRNAAYYSENSCGNSTSLIEQFSNGTEVYGSHFQCSATLPNGLSVAQPPDSSQAMQIMQTASNRTNFTDAISIDGSAFANFSMIAFTTSHCTSDWATGGARQPETDCIVANAVYTSDDLRDAVSKSQSQWPMYNVMAAECTISYCLQTYNTSIRDGVLQELAIPVIMEPLLQDGVPSRIENDLLDYIAVPCYVDGTPLNVAEITNGSFGGVPITYNNTNGTIPDECLYTISLQDYEALSAYFGPEGITYTNFFTGTGYIAYMDEVAQGMPNTFDPQWLEPLFSDAIANLSTVRDVFSGLAQAMTTHLRQTGTNSTPAQGVVYMNETCVKVVWAWVTVPATLIVSSCVFLMIVVCRSQALAKHKVWKSSSLALLFHGLDEDTRKDLGGLHTVSEMSRVAKNIHVELVCTDEGDRFIRNA